MILSQAGLAASDTVRVTLGPEEVLQAGAKWKFTVDEQWRESGVLYSNLPTGKYSVLYSSVGGWRSPQQAPEVFIENKPGTQVTHGLSVSYRRAPARALKVGAQGGEVVGDAWPAMAILDWVRISADSSRWEFLKARSHRTRQYPLTESDFAMPPDNQDYGVHLMAVPHPGFQFVGWNGVQRSNANPVTVHLNEDRDVAAIFAPVPVHTVTARLLAGPISSTGTLLLHAQFSYPTTNSLRHLVWNVVLPADWRLEGVYGLGQPRLSNELIHIGGDNGPALPTDLNPVQFNIRLRVPASLPSSPVLSGVVSYQLADSPRHFQTETPPVAVQGGFEAPVNLRMPPNATTGRLAVEVSGNPGEVLTLQVTDAIAAASTPVWNFLKLVTLTDTTPAPFRLEIPANESQRFYRAVRIE